MGGGEDMCLPLPLLKRSQRQQPKPPCQFHFSGVWKPTYQPSPYFSALFLKELGVNLLADDLGADVVFYSNAKSHLFKYKLDFLLFFHGAVCLHLSMSWKQHVTKDCVPICPISFHHEIAACVLFLKKYLQLLKNGCCLLDISTLLLDIGQGLRQPCTLNFYIDLRRQHSLNISRKEGGKLLFPYQSISSKSS